MVNFGRKIKVHKKCILQIVKRIIISERIEIPKCEPVGGDKLTCVRIKGADTARLDDDNQEEKLEGIITMVKDFYEKMNLLQVMYKNLSI